MDHGKLLDTIMLDLQDLHALKRYTDFNVLFNILTNNLYIYSNIYRQYRDFLNWWYKGKWEILSIIDKKKLSSYEVFPLVLFFVMIIPVYIINYCYRLGE